MGFKSLQRGATADRVACIFVWMQCSGVPGRALRCIDGLGQHIWMPVADSR